MQETVTVTHPRSTHLHAIMPEIKTLIHQLADTLNIELALNVTKHPSQPRNYFRIPNGHVISYKPKV